MTIGFIPIGVREGAGEAIRKPHARIRVSCMPVRAAPGYSDTDVCRAGGCSAAAPADSTNPSRLNLAAAGVARLRTRGAAAAGEGRAAESEATEERGSGPAVETPIRHAQSQPSC